MPLVLNGTTGVSGVDGSAGTPALQGTDSNTGIVFGTDTISLVEGGTAAFSVDSSANASLVGTLAMGSSFLRNRIINGDMRIDQRNNGASASSAASTYYLDRWQTVVSPNSKFTIQQNAGSITPPAGFTNYLGVTSSSAYSVASGEYQSLWQRIEGYNCADFGWGTASAKTVILSFWVYSSLTGTFGGAVQNSAVNRSYPFSYSIASANTWTYITITIPGDTSGTWLTTNGVGITLSFGLGVGSTFTAAAGSWAAGNYLSANSTTSVVGTNGATFYITGVQLEVGSVATPFERRQYGQELMLCQRYYEKSYSIDVAPGTNTTVGRHEFSSASDGASNNIQTVKFAVAKRAAPAMSFWSSGGTVNVWDYGRSGAAAQVTANSVYISTSSFAVALNVGATWTVSVIIGHWVASAEL